MKRALFVLLLLVLAVSALAQTDAVHRDDFQSYKIPSDPPGWVDTSVGEARPEAKGLFKVWSDPLAAGNAVYGTKQSSGKPEGTHPRIGTFSTLTTKTFTTRGRFEYRGRLLRTDSDSRIGLTFFSSYPAQDKYYLIGLWSQSDSARLTMQLFGFGAGALQGTLDSGVVLDPNRWYHFAIQADDAGGATKIRARFWPDGTAEPSTWSIDASDAAATRLTSGRIGMWAAVRGDAYVDDLLAKSPVDHATPVITFLDADTQRVLDPAQLALFKTPARIEIRVTDDGPGVATTAKLDGTTDYVSATPITADGMHTIAVTATDAPGNVTTATLQLLVDQQRPVVTLQLNGAPFPPGEIFDRDVTLSANIQDISATTSVATLNGALTALPQPIAEERLHEISVTATDRAGWQTTAASTFTVDKTAPVVTILANGEVLGGGESFQSDVVLTWTASDLTLDRVEATLDGTTVTSGTTVSADRVHDLVVKAYDRAGHVTTETRPFVLDTTAPEVRVLANGETFVPGKAFNVPVVFTLDASDTTPLTESVTIDGQSYTPGTPYEVAGAHTIQVVVTNAANLSTTVGPSPFTINRTPPAVTLTESGEPFRDGMKFNRDVHPVVTATDDLPDPERDLTLNGLRYPLDIAITEERVDHSISAKAIDAAGNEATVGPFRFLLDKTKPVVTLTDQETGEPFAADALFARPVRVKAAVADLTQTTITATLNEESFDLATPITADGTYTVSVVATDEVEWASDPVTATFTVDRTPPQLTFTSHQDGAVLTSGAIVVSGGADDAVVVTIGGVPVTLDLDAKTFLSETIALAEGPNVIVVSGTDKAGNTGTATLHLELDTRPPDLAITAPLPNACLAANELVVRGTLRDAVSVRVRENGGAPIDAAIDGSAWSATVPLPNEGAVLLAVDALDRAGHASTADVAILVDRTNPAIVATEGGAPFTGTVFSRVVTPSVRVADADLDTALVVTLDGQPFAAGTVLRDDATHVLRAAATDCAGNAATWEHTFTIDRTPPSIVAVTPANGASVGDKPALTGTLSEPATLVDQASGTSATVNGVSFTLALQWEEGLNERTLVATDAAGNVATIPYALRVRTSTPSIEIVESGEPIAANALFARAVTPVIRVSDASATITATLNGSSFTSGTTISADGTYTLVARATDTFGHVSEPASATFEIDRTAPRVTITAPANGASIAAATTEVRGTVDDATSVTVNGVAATLTGTTFTANVPLDSGANVLTATARDRAGNTGSAQVEVTRGAGALAIVLTAPPDGMLTNRATTVVAGQIFSDAATVDINGTAVPVSAGGAFRDVAFPLAEGPNAITASVTGTTGTRNSVTVNVRADFTPPVLRVTANALELADGARFATSPQLAVDATDDIGQGVITELTIDGERVTGAIAPFENGGHALTAIARDAAGNESRIDRTFFVGDAVNGTGCGLSDISPVTGAATTEATIRISGRSGGAASVLINGNAAQVADGSFCGEATLAIGRNEVVIQCADASGHPTSDEPQRLVVWRDPEPTIAITSPASGANVITSTVTVTGTAGAGVVSGDVNGIAFELPRDGAASHTFSVPDITLTAGLNTITARAKSGAGRIAVATAQVTLLNAAPQIAITSPIDGTDTGALSVDVTGTYVNVDPSTIAVNNASVTTTALSATAGTFRATVALGASAAATITATGRNAANTEARATIEVRNVTGAPSVSIASPADNTYLPSNTTQVPVSGTYAAVPGSQITVNGVLATLAGTTFTANVPIDTAAATPIVARITTPAGEGALDTVRVIRTAASLSLKDAFPAAEATGVDRGVAVILLFNNVLDASTVAGALHVTDSTGANVGGRVFVDRDAVTFAPDAALKASETYTIAIATSLKDLTGTALASAITRHFTTAATAPVAPPVLDDLATTGCFTTITMTGRATPNARVRLEADGVALNTIASATGAFKFTFSFSGRAGFHIARVRELGADGSTSSERALCFRNNCELPRVVGAALDRTARKLAIEFSRPMDPSTLTLGTTIVLDPPIAGTLSGTTITFTEDVPPTRITLTIKKEVKDLDGASMSADYTQSFDLDPTSTDRGKGYLRGAVYDATTGRPLPNATIQILNPQSSILNPSPTDARGRYARSLDEGAYTIHASADGYTPVWRQVVVPAGAGVVPIDIRLTRRGNAGGDTSITRRVEVTGATARVTAVGAQSLAGLLPLGWSPLASAEVLMDAAPAKLVFETGSVDRTLTLARYDAERDEWRVVVAAATAADNKVTLDITEGGHYAVVYPDAAPHLVHPPAPQTGAALQGVVDPCIAQPTQCTLTSRSFTLTPNPIPPNGRAAATLVAEGQTPIYPSGTAVQAYIDEQLNLADGRVLVDPPFATDLLLYRALDGGTAVADFHLAPTPQAAAVTLRDGVEHVRFVDYPGRIDRGTLLGNEGGRVPSDGNITIDVPAGATPEPLHASAATLPANELPASIQGFRVAGGFTLSLTRTTTSTNDEPVLEAPPTLLIPARATFAVPSPITNQVVVAEIVDTTQYGPIYRLVAIAQATSNNLFTTKPIDSTQLPLDGIVRDGRYVVLVAEAPIAYAFGLVRAGAEGAAIGSARVTANDLGVASLTPLSGLFVLPVLAKPAAPFSLVARTPQTGDGARVAASTAPDAGAFVDFGVLPLVAQPPALRSVTPDGGEIAITSAFEVRAEFDAAIDPASVAGGITVTNLTTGTPMTGTVTAAGNNVTFHPAEALRAASQYAIAIHASIRGTNGTPFGRTVLKNFRTQAVPAGGAVHPELIRITLPDANGRSVIRGTAGALPLGAQAVAVRRGRNFVVPYQTTVTASDGSFSFTAGEDPRDRIALEDLIDLQVIDAVSRGVIAVIPLTPFASNDLRSFLAPVGRDADFLSADNIRVRVPAGAFDTPTLITVTPSAKSAFYDVPRFDNELHFATAVELRFDGIAQKRIDVDVPVPANLDTNREWFIGYLGDSIRGPRVMPVDLAYAANGRFFTGLAPATSDARRIATNAGLTGPELREALLGINRSGIYATVAFETTAGPVGFAALSGIQQHVDLFYSTLESLYAAFFYLTEARGRIVVPVKFNTQFQIVGVDASTGIEAFTKAYDPIPPGDPGTIPTLEAPVTDLTGPFPILGSPFRIEIVDAGIEDVPIEGVRDFSLTLHAGAITATTDLDEAISVAMLNVTRGTLDPSRNDGLTLGASMGDRIVLLAGEQNVDPYTSFSIVFSEKLAVPSDEEALDAYLRAMFGITRNGQPIEGQLRMRMDAQRRIVFETPASLERGATYRLEISKDVADESGLKIGQTRNANGSVSPELAEPLYLEFKVREPGGKVASFDLASGVIRDQALNGNLLFVSALDGGIFAYDVANPSALTPTTPPVGHHAANAASYWALASDHHGRLYATGMTSLMGFVRSFRVEDFASGKMDVTQRAAAMVSYVPGAAASLNIGTRIIAGDRPEAIPRKLQILIQDAEPLAFANRADFKTVGGAVVTGTTGDLETLRYQTAFNPAKPYLVQRVTVENLTLDMRWSADATPTQAAIIEGIVARGNDQLRVIHNEATYGVVSLLGYGIAVLDLNAMESNDFADKPSSYETLREMVRLTNGKLPQQCGALPPVAIPDLEFTPDAAVRTEPGSSDIQVFALDPHRGVLDLRIHPPATEDEAKLPPDTAICEERMSVTGLVFQTTGYDHPRLAKLRQLFQARTGRVPFGRFNAAAPYVWTLEAKDNHVVTPSPAPGIPALGQRGSPAGERVQREYLLIPANEYGLLVVEAGGTAPAMKFAGAPPLAEGHLVDVIWIPGGANAVRTIPRTKLATVTDGDGHVLLVDLSRLDERWSESGPIADDALFPTVRAILESDVLTPDPRIVWRSAEPLASGTLAPVVDPDTGFVFAGKLLETKTNVISAIDPRIQIKADLGAADGFSEIGGVVPLGVAPPPSVALTGPNASLGAFRFEVTLPGALDEALPGGTFALEVESERVFGAKTADTPAGWPHAHATLPMQRAVPSSLTHLRFQRGFNKWRSPWVVAIADPRASTKYAWPAGADKAAAGCFSCERPQHLKNDASAVELFTNGRLLKVRPAATFANTPYEYLAQNDRLTARFSTVMADTVRAPEVQVPAQSPAIAGGMLQETTYLHSGEMESSAVDLVAEGRGGWDVVFDRTYRSRTIGSSPMGMGWDASIFRRLRALPDGNVEYRDGAGEVWLYKTDGAGGYTAPKGVFLLLRRNDRGWLMVDQKGRQTGFDDMGRVVFDGDEFATNPYAVDEGNVVRYLYGDDGLVHTIVDPIGRQSTLTYLDDRLHTVKDSRGRVVTYVYDEAGRLKTVLLPPVANTDGVTPQLTYGFQPSGASFNELLEIAPNINSIRDLKSVERVAFAYGTGNDRDKVIGQTWATSESATFSYSPNGAVVHDALKQERRYTLENARVTRLEEIAVETSTAPVGDLPLTLNRTPQTRTFTFSHHDEGMVAKATLEGVSVTTNTWTKAGGAPGFVLRATRTEAVGPVAGEAIDRTFGYATKSFVNSIFAKAGAVTKNVDVPVVFGKTRTSSVTNDAITETLNVDAYGRPHVTTSTGGTEPGGGSAATMHYLDDRGPWSGHLDRIDRAGIETRFTYPSPLQMVSEEPERSVRTTTELDAWLRPKKTVTTGPQLQLDEETDYDANGRVKAMRRVVDGRTITESFDYDSLGRLKSSKSDHVAVGENLTSTVESKTDYDLAARKITRTLPGGAVITERLDGLGRVQSRTTTTGSSDITEEFAYDLAGNLVYARDNHVGTATAYDVHGRAIATRYPDGTKTLTAYDPMGNPTLVEQRDVADALIARTEPSYTQSGRLDAIRTKVDAAQTRESTMKWDGAGRTTRVTTEDRFARNTFDDAGRLLSSATPFSTFTATGHQSSLVTRGVVQEQGSVAALQTSQQYDTLANVTETMVGPLVWRQSYDQDGNLTTALEPGKPQDATFAYKHDARGNVTEESKAGTPFLHRYDAAGAPSAYKDPVDPATTTLTDLIGRPRERTYPDQTTETFQWDGPRLLEMKDRQDRIFHYDYNDKGQLVGIRNPVNLIEQYEYDGAGRVEKWRTRDAELAYGEYDLEGRPRRTVQTRYADHSGFGAKIVLDSFVQEHEWNKHGERTAWTMPSAGALPQGWTVRVEQGYDAEGNVASITRTLSGTATATPLMSAGYRNAGRPAQRTVTTPAASIVRNYSYDAESGQLNDLTVSSNGTVVAGSRVEYDGVQIRTATLHGVSNGARANEYRYDLRGRLLTSSFAREAGAAVSVEHVDAADFRHALARPAGELPSLTFEREPGHKIASMTRGNEPPRIFDYAGRAERVSDGRFVYEFDARGRLIKATELPNAAAPQTALRRILYDYSASGRLVGRRAEYSVGAGEWALEDRADVLEEDALPADTTFVWDPISDQLVSIYTAGGATLVRQVIHGGNAYDDPIEVATAEGRLYPIFDEAATGNLQVVLNEQGELLSRELMEGAYGEDEFNLAGAAVDRIALTAQKDAAGNLETVEITVRTTDALDPSTVATGARLAVVHPDTGVVVRSASAVPSLIDNDTEAATLRWTLTGTEWNALVGGGTPEPLALSIAVTSTLRATAWGPDTPILPAPAPLHTSTPLPAELRELLPALTTWLATLPPTTPHTTTLYQARSLSTVARKGAGTPGRVVGARFQGLPFGEGGTGLVYMRARWYDPRAGAFLSPDPMGYGDSSNLYLGFGGDPVNNRDPLGTHVAEPMPVQPWRDPVVQPPRPGQRGPIIGPAPAPLVSLDAPPEDFHNVIAQWEAAKARRPKGAGARAFHGLTADELTPEQQQKFLAHRNRLRNDAAYREWWNSPRPQIGSIVLGKSPEMAIESLPALGGAGGGDDGGDDGIYWNNGWRTANGKFASPLGAGQSGREAEESVWDAVAKKPGWRITRGRVYVRDPDGNVRVYDGVAISPRGRAIGLEVKSGDARRTASQREFDQWLNSNPANTATPVGQNNKLPPVERSVQIRRPSK